MSKNIRPDKILDLKGLVCPFPWVKSKKALAKMKIGEVLKIIVDHAPAARNIPHNFVDEGQKVISVDNLNELDWQIIVEKEN